LHETSPVSRKAKALPTRALSLDSDNFTRIQRRTKVGSKTRRREREREREREKESKNTKKIAESERYAAHLALWRKCGYFSGTWQISAIPRHLLPMTSHGSPRDEERNFVASRPWRLRLPRQLSRTWTRNKSADINR